MSFIYIVSCTYIYIDADVFDVHQPSIDLVYSNLFSGKLDNYLDRLPTDVETIRFYM